MPKIKKKSKKLVKKERKKPKEKKKKIEIKEIKKEEQVKLEDLETLVDAEQFQELISPRVTAPVLDQVEVDQETPIFIEERVRDVPTIPGTEKPDPTKYLSKAQDENVKYVSDRSSDIPLKRPNLRELGIKKPEINQEAFSRSDISNLDNGSKKYEVRGTAKWFDPNKAGTEKPFEKKDKKYDFELPTS